MLRGYVSVPTGTIPRTIPHGRILIHNHIRHTPKTGSGLNGFRAWTEPEATKPDHYVKCRCKWSGLPHYHVSRK